MSNETLDGDAVQQIERIVQEAATATLRTTTIGKDVYSTRKLHRVVEPEPEPQTLVLRTLTSLAEYVKGKADEEYRAERATFLHVASPTHVRLCTGVFGLHRQRVTVATAEAIVPSHSFGQFQPHEGFAINLQANFEDTPSRRQIQAVIGTLETEAVQTSKDDGTTQQVVLRQGLMRKEQEVPSPVELRPYCSFPEIASPTRPFVLRLRGGGEGAFPSCALFECDGGRWQLVAVERIKAFLRLELGEGFPIYG